MDKLINQLLEKQIEQKMIDKEQKEIFYYGYVLIIETFLNIITGIIVGILFNEIRNVILFWLCYIPLRIFSGGWHASKGYLCYIVSNLALIVEILFAKHLYINLNMVFVFFEIAAICLFVILAPVDTPNKKLDRKEYVKYKIISIIILSIEIVCTFLFFNLWKVTFFTHFILVLSLILQQIINKQK